MSDTNQLHRGPSLIVRLCRRARSKSNLPLTCFPTLAIPVAIHLLFSFPCRLVPLGGIGMISPTNERRVGRRNRPLSLSILYYSILHSRTAPSRIPNFSLGARPDKMSKASTTTTKKRNKRRGEQKLQPAIVAHRESDGRLIAIKITIYLTKRNKIGKKKTKNKKQNNNGSTVKQKYNLLTSKNRLFGYFSLFFLSFYFGCAEYVS